MGEKEKETRRLLQIYHQVLEVPEGEHRGKGDGPQDDPGRFPPAGGVSCQAGQAACSSVVGKRRTLVPEPLAQDAAGRSSSSRGRAKGTRPESEQLLAFQYSLGNKEVGRGLHRPGGGDCSLEFCAARGMIPGGGYEHTFGQEIACLLPKAQEEAEVLQRENSPEGRGVE